MRHGDEDNTEANDAYEACESGSGYNGSHIAFTGMATLIGDFEGSLDPGWGVTGGATGEISTDWASSGTSSLKVTPGPISGNNFAWALQFNDLATTEQLSSTHTLMFDVYWDSSEWLPDTGSDAWVRWDNASLNGGATGWTQTSDSNINDPRIPVSREAGTPTLGERLTSAPWNTTLPNWALTRPGQPGASST